MPVSSLFKHISLLDCILKGKERFYLFYRKNTGLSNPLFQEAAALRRFDDERILRSKREFLIKTHQIRGFLGLVECRGSFLPSNCLFWTSSVWSSFTVHKHAFLGIEHSSCLQAPFRSTACMLFLPDFSLQPLLLATEEKQSQGTEQKQSKGM